MARQRFFPRTFAAQQEWLRNYALKLQQLAPALALPPDEVAASVADALYLAYCTGVYQGAARSFSKAATSAVRDLRLGVENGPLPMPVFHPPPLPPAMGPLPAVVPVPAGALRRILRFAQLIKLRPGYTSALGQQLGIIGAGEAAGRAVPEFTLEVITGLSGQQVRIKFRKYGHKGVVIYSRRGGGDWERIGIDMASPFVDERPLRVPGQPEAREYRLQFFEDDHAAGDFTPVATVIVGG